MTWCTIVDASGKIIGYCTACPGQTGPIKIGVWTYEVIR